MTIRQQGGVFGRNPEFNDVSVNDLSVSNELVTTGTASFGSSVFYPSPLNVTFTDRVQANGANGYGGNFSAFSWSSGTDTGASFILARSDSGTVGTHQLVGSADVLGSVRFYGSDGTKFVQGARIHAVVDGTPSADDMPTSLRFSTTADGAASVTERMRINSAGNVGIAVTNPSERLSVSGNVTITGSLSKGSGSFKIDHPLKPDTHHLVHSFIEGPQADNLYRGKAKLVGGSASVNLDEAGRMTEGTFAALNGNVQCFTTNENGWTQVRGKVNGNVLTVEAQDKACTDEVSWLVIGERHDQHMIDTPWTDENGRVIVEPEKIIAPEMEAE